MAFWNAVKGIAHQVNPFDNGRTYDTNAAGKNPGYRQTTTSKPSSGGNSVSDFLNRNYANPANLQPINIPGPYIPPQPKLAQFDLMANWRNAQSAAEKAVNPKYDQLLNDYLAQNVARQARGRQEFGLKSEKADTDQRYSLEDNATTRTRTTEDVAGAVQKLNTQEGEFQTDEGQDFDINYRQAAEQLAASGGAATGLGKQQTADMIRLRNVTSQRQLDEFQGQRMAKELFKTRTFEDLARGDTRAGELNTYTKKAAQFDLDKYLEDLAFEEKNKRWDIEQDRLSEVSREAMNFEKAQTEQFLAGLVGKGYSASDIAYNRSLYG